MFDVVCVNVSVCVCVTCVRVLCEILYEVVWLVCCVRLCLCVCVCAFGQCVCVLRVAYSVKLYGLFMCACL